MALQAELVDSCAQAHLLNGVVVVEERYVVDHALAVSLHILGAQEPEVVVAYVVSDDSVASEPLALEELLDPLHKHFDLNEASLFEVVVVEQVHDSGA